MIYSQINIIRKISKAFVFVFLLFQLIACKPEIPITGISLSSSTVSMSVGESIVISATVSPENADNNKVKWSSDSPSVASVSGGKIVANSSGVAIITASSSNGEIEAICIVKVFSKVIDISFQDLPNSIMKGDTYQLRISLSPSDANPSVTYTSSNSSIAIVDASGNVKALESGSVNITVTTVDGTKSATCSLNIEAPHVWPTGVSLNRSSLELKEGESFQLTATVYPSDATNKEVRWKSENTNVATVDNNGKVTGVKAGSTIVQVFTAEGGKSATTGVTVKAKTSS
ncbi:MAG: Ig domain-containing protein [Bacteroidales bacterium]|nr:Ig domain-containing protein [Bacteroidales bacterium]